VKNILIIPKCGGEKLAKDGDNINIQKNFSIYFTVGFHSL